MIETLTCAAGHDFTRETVRGKKPQWCPDHKPQSPKPAEARTTARKTLVRPEALEILKASTDRELIRKLEYVVVELRKPSRSDDHVFLDSVQKSLIREHHRVIR